MSCSASKTLPAKSATERAIVWGAGEAQCRFAYTESRRSLLPPQQSPAYHRWHLPSGEDWITFHHDAGNHVLRFPDLADFHIGDGGARVHCEALNDVADEDVRHLLWNSVLPLAASGQGATVLHGGAVEVDAAAIAFLGSTGQGKSTLTAAFAAQGRRFLTDDALQVAVGAQGRVLAAPGQPHIRLWQQGTVDKQRLLAGPGLPHCPQERPLRAIYLLGTDAGAVPLFEPVRPATALIELVQNAFLLDPASQDLLRAQHDSLCAIVRNVPVFRIDYARRHALLPQLCDAVLAHARSLP